MESLNLIKNDPWLAPYKEAIEGRYQYVVNKEKNLTGNGRQTLSEMASGYLYFGLHKTKSGWVFREWAPNATAIYMIGTFNEWKKDDRYKLQRLGNGIWEIALAEGLLRHEDLFKLLVEWEGGCGERIPAWIRRVVQDENTKIFSAQVWNPEKPYVFKHKRFKPNVSPLLIYECHIGMASNEEKVGSYDEFRRMVLPRIAKEGYNAIQIMAIQEHPYYGSFGYHVSSFFAASSRFGTPEELKQLIDEAHSMGIAVIMDIVHSHAVKNEVEGLGRFDGSYTQYFLGGARREHPAWDSLCFDYGKNEVLHFLLSNCKFWLDEYKFDGFRFDGVTSMLYYSHGLGEAFCNYADYFNGHQDGDAIAYLTLANKLIHEVNKNAITIAEEVSGMPGLAAKYEDGGYGFDYRMAMNIPDYWIKTIKEKKDEDWHPSSIWWETTNRRADENAYLVLGGKVLITAGKNIMKGQVFDENFLMCIATIGAFCIQEFPEAVGVMLFYRIGEYFEEKATEQSRTQIMEAVDLRPEVVNLVIGNDVRIIDAEEANVGDILLVRPGDRIPLDGVIIDGESRIDTSPVTGEPVPVMAKTGDNIVSGCVNTSGQLKIRVEKILEESMVTRILDSVENAAASKPNIDKFITRFARVYTPFVVLFALFVAVVLPFILPDSLNWHFFVDSVISTTPKGARAP